MRFVGPVGLVRLVGLVGQVGPFQHWYLGGEMKALREVTSRAVNWIGKGFFNRDYELKSGSEQIATLHWEKGFGSLATGRTADACWTFKRGGFLRPRVMVRPCGADYDVAIFHPNWRGDGAIEFADGRRLLWRHSGFWRVEWVITTEKGERLVAFKPGMHLTHEEAVVEIEKIAHALGELPLLVVLGWYLIILSAHEDAAAAAASVGG